MSGPDHLRGSSPDHLRGSGLADATRSTGGVHRLPGPASGLERALAAAGWRTGVVADARTKGDFLAAVGRALRFPAWYGANLDALADCLGDLEAPTALVWAGSRALAAAHPRDHGLIQRVLADRAAERPAFALVLVTDEGAS